MALSVGTNGKSTMRSLTKFSGHTRTDNHSRRLRHQLLAHLHEIQRQIDKALAKHRAAQAQLREESGGDVEDMSIRDSQNHQAYSVLEVWNNKRNMLDAALRRLDDGTYGFCEDCLAPISEPRLKALPFVRRCIECQQRLELLEHIAKK